MFRSSLLWFSIALLFASLTALHVADELVVYPPVPGLAASEHYQLRVRSVSAGSEGQSAFARETVCELRAIERDSSEFAQIRGCQP
jgi:hypothetical protein